MFIGFSAFTNTGEKGQPFLIFTLFCVIVGIIDQLTPKEYHSYYYLFCAFVDLVIIHKLSKIPITNTVILLQRACLLFIVINFLGWVTYMMYFNPYIYDALCASLFAVILLASENTRKTNVLGDNSIYSNINVIFGNLRASLLQVQSYSKASKS